MGIINPRPAMRAREERNLRSTLGLHQMLRIMMREAGATDKDASKMAFDIIVSRAARKKIWRIK
jgi:hypothetical protein